ncbi:MAG: hypothetical protein KDD33_12540 [Bdellovibrionales bacterium]|nr:hypothetical protein [Bdellovibrionales bacterium]
MKRHFSGVILSCYMVSLLLLFQNCKEKALTSINDDSRNPASISDNAGSVRAASANNELAVELHKRLAGATPNLDDPILTDMENLISQGQLEEAALVATHQPSFYSITLRDFAVKMTNKEQSVSFPLNDLAATIIGGVRDDINATEFFTGNFFYKGNASSGAPQDLKNDIILSNNHYESLDNSGANLMEVLERVNGQQVVNPQGNLVALADSGGILTSRAFMAAHADAGTNRRIIEYSFKVFLCKPMDEWANSSNPDNRVGRDVGRFPQADYLAKCKGCHTGMDALRPATAHFDFFDGGIRYKYSYPMDPNPNDPSQLNIPVASAEQDVPYKFRRASDNFPQGFAVTDDNWSNYASDEIFGFRTPSSGQGMADLARLVAYSEQFSRCMVQRVFKSVCRRDSAKEEKYLIERLAQDFERDYNLRHLFVNVALQPECTGVHL